jgi:hypothetical protein
MDTKVIGSHISSKTGKTTTLKTHLLEFTDTDDRDWPGATVEFGIPKRVRALLIKSSRWGRVPVRDRMRDVQKYTMALYEMICLRANLERCVETMDIQKFRELVGVPPEA